MEQHWERGFLIAGFTLFPCPLEFKEVQSYTLNNTEINPGEGKATGEDFLKRQGEQEVPTSSNTSKIHKINSIQALTRDEQDFCSAVRLVAGGSEKKIASPEH